MFSQIDYIMVTVSDMARSVEFYRDKLGLTLKFASPEWTEFQTGATTLSTARRRAAARTSRRSCRICDSWNCCE